MDIATNRKPQNPRAGRMGVTARGRKRRRRGMKKRRRTGGIGSMGRLGRRGIRRDKIRFVQYIIFTVRETKHFCKLFEHVF